MRRFVCISIVLLSFCHMDTHARPGKLRERVGYCLELCGHLGWMACYASRAMHPYINDAASSGHAATWISSGCILASMVTCFLGDWLKKTSLSMRGVYSHTRFYKKKYNCTYQEWLNQELFDIIAEQDDEQWVQTYINCGAQVNAHDNQCRTPVSLALQRCRFGALRVLLENGAYEEPRIEAHPPNQIRHDKARLRALFSRQNAQQIPSDIGQLLLDYGVGCGIAGAMVKRHREFYTKMCVYLALNQGNKHDLYRHISHQQDAIDYAALCLWCGRCDIVRDMLQHQSFGPKDRARLLMHIDMVDDTSHDFCMLKQQLQSDQDAIWAMLSITVEQAEQSQVLPCTFTQRVRRYYSFAREHPELLYLQKQPYASIYQLITGASSPFARLLMRIRSYTQSPAEMEVVHQLYPLYVSTYRDESGYRFLHYLALRPALAYYINDIAYLTLWRKGDDMFLKRDQQLRPDKLARTVGNHACAAIMHTYYGLAEKGVPLEVIHYLLTFIAVYDLHTSPLALDHIP